MPQCAAGPRIEPPVSDPSVPIARPEAIAAPDPLLEPPVTWSRFHGLQAWSNRLVLGPPNANSCMASLPRLTAPASRSRTIAVLSSAGTRCSSTFDCPVVRTPSVSYRSL